MQQSYDRHGLFRELRERFVLDWQGIHGVPHWARVKHHGLRVGRQVGANLLVVELFAFLHDSCRVDDDGDRAHGCRAADFAVSLNGRYFDLRPRDLALLHEAISQHSDGRMHRDPTIQTCWDADRLDLGRVGVVPRREMVSRAAAPLIDSALDWSGY